MSYFEFDVQFAPSFRANYQEKVSIVTDGRKDPTLEILVRGKAEGAEAEITDDVYFEDTNEQTVSTSVMTVQNVGEAPLQITNVRFERYTADGGTSVDGGELTNYEPSRIFQARHLDGGSPFPIPLNQYGTTNIPMTFKPTDEGIYSVRAVVVSPNANAVFKPFTARGTRPRLKLSPDKLSFPGVVMGSSVSDSFTILNEGSGPVSIRSISVAGGADYVCNPDGSNRDTCVFTLNHEPLPLELGSKQVARVTVTFRPIESTRSAKATWSVVPTNNLPTMSLEVLGAVALQPITVLADVSFGKQLINNRSAPSSRVLSIYNSTSEVVHLSNPIVEGGDDCAVFQTKPGQSWPVAIAPSAVSGDGGTQARSTDIELFFNPQKEGVLNGCQLKLSFLQLRDQLSVKLTGEGIPKLLSTNVPEVDFKAVRLGAEQSIRVAITNESDDPVELNEPTVSLVSGERFELKLIDPTSKIIGARQTRYVDVLYKPREDKSSESMLVLGTKKPELLKAVVLLLKGKATPRLLTTNTADLNFFQVDVNGEPKTETFVVRNASSEPKLVELYMRNGAESSFTVTPNKFDLGPEGEKLVTVAFKPKSAGDADDTVLIKLQDRANPEDSEATVEVMGAGQILTGRGGCSAGGMGSASAVVLLTLMALRSRRRRE
ncbi:choice-of-anchor D domain-containing protein [Melittangium boletus]|uniref:choice-of-anchor D domain-containing protein n=1 Tax=Melittangium boletus TaxID=83453 RepID=UPI003DA627FC